MNNFRTLREFVENAIQIKILQTEMFGVDIESFMAVQKNYVKFLQVPWVVRLCADEMIRRGFGLEGIFRVPGSHGIITNICKTFNNGEVPDFSADEIGLEEVSGVFKKYLRELPEPLLKDDSQYGELHAKFCAVLNINDEVGQVMELRKLIPRLSEYRRALVKEIFFVLFLVSRESEVNLMDAMNLGTIFGGMVNIISDTLFTDEKKRLCCLLIEYYPEIFCEIDMLVRQPQVELTEEQKEAKVAVSIFLDDGTHRTFWIQGGDTSEHVRGLLVNKLQAQLPITDKWDLFEVRDRDVRQLELGELVYPLVKEGHSILFSGNIDQEELKVPWHVALSRGKAQRAPLELPKEPKIEEIQMPNPEIASEDKKSALPSISPTVSDSALTNSGKVKRKSSKSSGKDEYEIKKEGEPKMESEPKKESAPVIATLSVEDQINTSLFESVKLKLTKFVNSEDTYRVHLEILSQFYKEQIRKVVTPEQFSALFGQFDALFMLHQQMKQRLTVDNIGSVVLGMMSYFKMYGQLRVGERVLRKTLSKVMKEGSKTLHAIEKCKKESKCEKNLDDLLLSMQVRLQEYEEGLLSKLLMEAYKSICALNSDINEQTEVSKTGYLLYKLQRTITNLPPNDLIIPTRRFLRQTSAQIKFGDSTLGSCQLLLFNDIILVYSQPDTSQSKKGKNLNLAATFTTGTKFLAAGVKGQKKNSEQMKGNFEFILNVIDLEGVQAVNDDVEFPGETSFLLLASKSNTGTTVVYKILVSHPVDWQEQVQGAISIIQESRQTFISFQQKQEAKAAVTTTMTGTSDSKKGMSEGERSDSAQEEKSKESQPPDVVIGAGTSEVDSSQSTTPTINKLTTSDRNSRSRTRSQGIPKKSDTGTATAPTTPHPQVLGTDSTGAASTNSRRKSRSCSPPRTPITDLADEPAKPEEAAARDQSPAPVITTVVVSDKSGSASPEVLHVEKLRNSSSKDVDSPRKNTLMSLRPKSHRKSISEDREEKSDLMTSLKDTFRIKKSSDSGESSPLGTNRKLTDSKKGKSDK